MLLHNMPSTCATLGEDERHGARQGVWSGEVGDLMLGTLLITIV
jgi:hypothetical protein